MLITHLDAVEVHRVTNKPTRAVTLFLFTDKILVASKSSIDSKEINLQQLLDPSSNNVVPTSSSSASLLLSSSSNHHHQSNTTPLKFKGWADVESIELFEGVTTDRPCSFILSATHLAESGRSDLTSFERYFYKGPRLFQVKNTVLLKEFQTSYQRTRAFNKKRNDGDTLLYKMWHDIPTYCNTYSLQNYMKSNYKNDTLIIYMDDQDTAIQIQDILPSSSQLYHPWIIGIIQPEKLRGFRFQIYTKIQFSNYHRYYTNSSSSASKEQTIDFEHIFWNNSMKFQYFNIYFN